MQYYTAIKSKWPKLSTVLWMNLTDVVSGEGSQTTKISSYVIPLYEVQKYMTPKWTSAIEVRIVGTFAEWGGSGQRASESTARVSRVLESFGFWTWTLMTWLCLVCEIHQAAQTHTLSCINIILQQQQKIEIEEGGTGFWGRGNSLSRYRGLMSPRNGKRGAAGSEIEAENMYSVVRTRPESLLILNSLWFYD